MGRVIITFRVMPESPEVNLDALKAQVLPKIEAFGGDVGKDEIEPVAFGLKALKIFFILDEDKGSTEKLEEELTAITGIKSVEVVDVRRTF